MWSNKEYNLLRYDSDNKITREISFNEYRQSKNVYFVNRLKTKLWIKNEILIYSKNLSDIKSEYYGKWTYTFYLIEM